jgi:hypothetical protein
MAAPLAHVALGRGFGTPAWPTLAMLVLGLTLRQTGGSPLVAAVALALAPVWQVLVMPLGADTSFELVMPWLALLGSGLARPGPGAWRSRGPWLPAIAGWGLVVALSGAVVAARELDFPRVTLAMLTRDAVTAGAPPLATMFVLVAVQAQLAALLVFDWYAGASETERRRVWRALAPGTAAAIAVALWQQSGDAAFLSREPWIGLHRAAGTFFDANAMAALAALTGPVLASSFVRPAAVPALVWSALVWAAATGAVVATGSRTALASLAVVAVLQVASRGTRRQWFAIAVVAAAAGAYLAFNPVPERLTGNAIGRLAGSLSSIVTTGRSALWSLLWTRDGYGPAAMALIADHPWVGGGIGMFGTLVSDYGRMASGMALPPDNAQNWWRHMMAEVGLLGALPALACSVLAAIALARGIGRRELALAAAPLAGLGLMSLVSPPTQHPIIHIVTALVVAHAVSVGARPQSVTPAGVRGGAIIWALAIACAVGTAAEGWRAFRPPYRAARFHALYSYGVTGTLATPFGEGRWAAARSLAVVEPGGATLVVRVVAPHDDLATTPAHITVSTRLGTVCTFEARDHSPFECRLPVTANEWPLARVDVDRLWRREDGMTKAALVSARFEP